MWRARGCCTRASFEARTPVVVHRDHRCVGGPVRCPGGCIGPNPGVHEQWYTSMGKDVPTRSDRRSPRARGASRGRPGGVGDVAEAPWTSSRSTTSPLPPVVDYGSAHGLDALVHEQYPDNVAGFLGVRGVGASGRCVRIRCSRAAIHQQAYAPVPTETRGMVAEWSGEELTVRAATQSPHEVRMFLAPLLGIGEHQILMRDTGGGFGQKVAPMREDMCIALGGHGAAEVDRRSTRELLAADVNTTRSLPHGVRRRRSDRRGTSTTSRTSAPTRRRGRVGTAAAVGMLFPGPYRVPTAGVPTTSVFSNTSGVSWPVGAPSGVPRSEVLLDIAARRMSIDPIELRRQHPPPGGASLHQPQRHALQRQPKPSSRPWPCSTSTPSDTSKPRSARLAATSDGRRPTRSRPPPDGLLRDRRCDDRDRVR